MVLAIILALEAKQPSDRDIVSSVFGAVVVVVLADAYAHYIGTTIATGVRPSAREMRATLVGEIGALVAVLPVVFLLMLGVAGVIRLDTGFTAAKWTGVAVIGVYAFVAHRRAGLTTGKSFPPAIFLALVGLGLVLLKSYFH